MIILYLAILVIIIGVIFVITSVEVVRPGRKPSMTSKPMNVVIEDSVVSNERRQDEDDLIEVDIPQVTSGKNLLDDSSFEVVLYNDETGISMDENRSFTSDIASLKNVVRVGRGIAEIGPDGITIRIEKNLYRFDYYRLEKVISRDNHAVLLIKGASGSHIIVSEDGNFPGKLQQSYSSFQGK